MEQETPNLFSYATNELSQDAFICWSIEWAKPENNKADRNLHEYGVTLINAFFKKAGRKAPAEIKTVEVSKQCKSIDAFCIVNGTYPIIIEDKINTKNHSDQLQRYLEIIKKNYPKCKDDILSIYFKTGDQSSYKNVKDNGYTPFLRQDILAVLAEYNGKNPILCDYRAHIQGIEDKVQSYQSQDIKKWRGKQWTGFYIELQKRLNKGNWEEVHPRGKKGFMAFHWGWQGEKKDFRQYLQLEQDKLCFKVEHGEVTNQGKKWHKMIMGKAGEFGLKLSKPARLKNGKTMTVCVFDGDYRQTKDGVIDMDETIKILNQVEKLLASLKE